MAPLITQSHCHVFTERMIKFGMWYVSQQQVFYSPLILDNPGDLAPETIGHTNSHHHHYPPLYLNLCTSHS